MNNIHLSKAHSCSETHQELKYIFKSPKLRMIFIYKRGSFVLQKLQKMTLKNRNSVSDSWELLLSNQGAGIQKVFFFLRVVMATFMNNALCLHKKCHGSELPFLWRKGLRSGQSLKEQDLLIDAEPVQHNHQVLATAGHLALHGQAEVLLHALGDAPSDRVVLDQHSLIGQ